MTKLFYLDFINPLSKNFSVFFGTAPNITEEIRNEKLHFLANIFP